MEKEILTIEEVSSYLQIGTRSLYKLAKDGKLPAKKVLNKWRFEKESLREWIREGDHKWFYIKKSKVIYATHYNAE